MGKIPNRVGLGSPCLLNESEGRIPLTGMHPGKTGVWSREVSNQDLPSFEN